MCGCGRWKVRGRGGGNVLSSLMMIQFSQGGRKQGH